MDFLFQENCVLSPEAEKNKFLCASYIFLIALK